MAATYIETKNGVSGMSSDAIARWRDRVVEGFWFSLCLVLFMILGPFSAPIVLGFVLASKLPEGEMQEPEMIREEEKDQFNIGLS